MYNIEAVGNKLKAWVHYGDDLHFTAAVYEDDGVTPIDLTGQTIILGIETNSGVKVLEILGTVSSNEVLFEINYSLYSPTEIKEGTGYKFDYWSKTTRLTFIPKSDIKFEPVAHDTEV